jgi:hypothetical protein
LGEATDRGGEPLAARVRSFPLDAGTRDRHKTWSKFRLHCEFQGEVEFRLGFHDIWEAEPDWTDWLPMVEDYWLPGVRSSVFVTLEIHSLEVSASWRLGVFQGFGYMGGAV